MNQGFEQRVTSLENELAEMEKDLKVEQEQRIKFESQYEKVAVDFEESQRKKEKYAKSYEKYHKMTGKMREEIQRDELENAELQEEINMIKAM